MNYPSYTLIDQNTWPRKEHFNYYRNVITCSYTVTSKINVTKLYHFAKEHQLRFYACFVYCAAKTVNSMAELKMMTDKNGNPGIWDVSHPVFTVFHKDDETFSDLWCHYHADMKLFCKEFDQVITEYGNHHGIKGRNGQPSNFFCISCVPWLDYTGYCTSAQGVPALFPIITFGKYTEKDGQLSLPVSFCISHASADGYHASKFFQTLQTTINRLDEFYSS